MLGYGYPKSNPGPDSYPYPWSGIRSRVRASLSVGDSKIISFLDLLPENCADKESSGFVSSYGGGASVI